MKKLYYFKFSKHAAAFATLLSLVAYSPAQDIHFSQFYMTPLNLNPANAGAENNQLQGILNYKDQWKSIGSPYRTFAATCHTRLKIKRRSMYFWAGGMNLFSDRAGDIKMGHFQANFSGAYHRYVNKRKLATIGIGLQTGFAQRSISYDAVTWGNQWDGYAYNSSLSSGETTPASSFIFGDFLSAGIVYTYNKTSGALKVKDNNDFRYSIGLSGFHLTRPKYSYLKSDEKLYIKYVFHGQALMSIKGTNVGFMPGYFYFRQGPTQEIYMGSLVRYKFQQASKYTHYYKGTALSLGGFLRAKDAAIVALLFEHYGYSFGLSYDINVSDLKVASSGKGGFEFALRAQLGNPFLAEMYSKSKF